MVGLMVRRLAPDPTGRRPWGTNCAVAVGSQHEVQNTFLGTGAGWRQDLGAERWLQGLDFELPPGRNPVAQREHGIRLSVLLSTTPALAEQSTALNLQ